MGVYEPSEFDQIERDEHAAQLRLSEAREQAKRDEGSAEHESLIEKLEHEWQKARDRLDQARQHKSG